MSAPTVTTNVLPGAVSSWSAVCCVDCCETFVLLDASEKILKGHALLAGWGWFYHGSQERGWRCPECAAEAKSAGGTQR